LSDSRTDWPNAERRSDERKGLLTSKLGLERERERCGIGSRWRVEVGEEEGEIEELRIGERRWDRGGGVGGWGSVLRRKGRSGKGWRRRRGGKLDLRVSWSSWRDWREESVRELCPRGGRNAAGGSVVVVESAEGREELDRWLVVGLVEGSKEIEMIWRFLRSSRRRSWFEAREVGWVEGRGGEFGKAGEEGKPHEGS